LRVKLAQAGIVEENILGIDRSNLFEAMANVILKQETEREPVDESRDASAMEVRLRELALEELKVKTDADIRKREADARNKEREVEMRKIELDMEMRKRQLEVNREVLILELRGQQEVETRDGGYVGLDFGSRRTWDDSLAGRTKRYGDTLKHVLPQMPTEITELPQFFDTVEKLYDMYEVPDDLQAKLLIPLLTGHAKTVIGLCRLRTWSTMLNLRNFC